MSTKHFLQYVTPGTYTVEQVPHRLPRIFLSLSPWRRSFWPSTSIFHL